MLVTDFRKRQRVCCGVEWMVDESGCWRGRSVCIGTRAECTRVLGEVGRPSSAAAIVEHLEAEDEGTRNLPWRGGTFVEVAFRPDAWLRYRG